MINFSNQIDLGHLMILIGYIVTAIAFIYGMRGQINRVGDRMDGFVERMAAVENEMKKLTDIAVALARYDERILAMTTRLNLMDKRWEELRHGKDAGL
jgi:pilus assembly protein TadC